MIRFSLKGEGDVLRSIQSFAEVTGRSLADEIIAMGRLVAVDLARQTQPYGVGKSAQEAGENRVAGDISRVFVTPQTVFSQLEDKRPGDANLFWKAHKDNDSSFMQEIMSRNSIDLSISNKPDPAIHSAARNRRGQVAKNYRARQLVRHEQTLKSYIAKKKRTVGLAKSGWAQAADMLGGHRGVPHWASGRHRGNHGGAVISRDLIRPTVTLLNHVRYAADAIENHAIDKAIEDVYTRSLKRINLMIAANARRSGLSRAA